MHVPLANSFVISSKKGNETIVVPVVDKNRSTYEFRVQSTGLSKLEIEKAQNGTKAGKAKDFVCLLSGSPIQREYIRAEGKQGRRGVRIMAVVAEGTKYRLYLSLVSQMV